MIPITGYNNTFILYRLKDRLHQIRPNFPSSPTFLNSLRLLHFHHHHTLIHKYFVFKQHISIEYVENDIKLIPIGKNDRFLAVEESRRNSALSFSKGDWPLPSILDFSV